MRPRAHVNSSSVIIAWWGRDPIALREAAELAHEAGRKARDGLARRDNAADDSARWDRPEGAAVNRNEVIVSQHEDAAGGNLDCNCLDSGWMAVRQTPNLGPREDRVSGHTRRAVSEVDQLNGIASNGVDPFHKVLGAVPEDDDVTPARRRLI